MCYNAVQQEAKIAKLEEHYNAVMTEPEHYQPIYKINGFARPSVLIITEEDISTIEYAIWSILPPHYDDDPEFYWKTYKGGVLNTRIESLFNQDFNKPARNWSWKQQSIVHKKCVFLVNGIYEFHHPNNAKPIPFLFSNNMQQFCLPGIYTEQEDGELCFSIFTKSAREMYKIIHNGGNNKWRQPIPLSWKLGQSYLQLYKPKYIEQFILDSEPVELTPYPISRDFNNSRIDSNRADITQRFFYRENETGFE